MKSDVKQEKSIVHGTANNQTQANGSQSKAEKRKKKAKKQKPEPPDNSDKIVDLVLRNSSFKKADLSEIVDQKFHDEIYRSHYKRLISDINYKEITVKFHPNVDYTVLPDGLDPGKLNVVPAHAFMHLPSIHDKPPVRRRVKKKKNPKQNNIAQAKTNSDHQQNNLDQKKNLDQKMNLNQTKMIEEQETNSSCTNLGNISIRKNHNMETDIQTEQTNGCCNDEEE